MIKCDMCGKTINPTRSDGHRPYCVIKREPYLGTSEEHAVCTPCGNKIYDMLHKTCADCAYIKLYGGTIGPLVPFYRACDGGKRIVQPYDKICEHFKPRGEQHGEK